MPFDEDDIEGFEAKGSEGMKEIMRGLSEICEDEEGDEGVAEACLDACLRMKSEEGVNAELVASIPTLALTLEKFMDEATVIEVLFAVLTNVVTKSESQSSFGTESNVKNVIKAMDIHSEGEETLIEYACLLIESLALENEAARIFFIEAGAESRLKMAENVITNVRNQKYVVAARAALKL
mmetsp:Transcript_14091/g.20563  ORF Transcript_14091/g.20563 Transcript_14091/m.20563 type:complete len:181 (+) Transcript_14091:73-615(+)|eukprot:CAMPEP_0195517958 /NCGR_PEP_ID=MMETSP0794_2-20130614/11844_1 /TAXON_ID=515487 /ORGANISM="Stephanopyxis turris, Strain CCMP 815" /LENGTH=180 /DNA_ID=CAMNT_0040646843 /DNA_START=47 /DNA_END=589 /DNA_ORIENTATION=-